MSFKKKVKNDWGSFKADNSNGNLMLLTKYPAANKKKEVAWRIDMSLKNFDYRENASYDGIMVTLVKEDNSFTTTYLEIGVNQLEALRQHLNDWHEKRGGSQ